MSARALPDEPPVQGTGLNAGAIEKHLLQAVREDVLKLLDRPQTGVSGAEDEERVREIIAGHIRTFNRRAAMSNLPQLSDTPGITRRILDDIFRLGPIQPLMDDPTVEEILINSPWRIYIIQAGRKQLTTLLFADSQELLQFIKRVLGRLGRHLDEATPMVDVRLPDGSRLNAAIPPVATRYPSVTIRKFLLKASSLTDLVRLGTLTEEAAEFLDAAVQARLNILISGGTGSGKTTTLNSLGACLTSPNERVITIEETAELQLDGRLPDCIALQARAANSEGAGAIPIRTLVRNALRMRPTRIVVGEVRGAEALDMLDSMNSGHEGSLATIHANSPRQALSKLRGYAMRAEEALPAATVTEMIAETINLVLQIELTPEGRRMVTSIYEVTGLEGGMILGNELFKRREDDANGRPDTLCWTGIPPRCLARFKRLGLSPCLGPLDPATAVSHPEEHC